MSDKEDLYELLGVGRNATNDEIKKAYKKLAKKHHPDKGGDEDYFKKIANAYDVLSNSEKRSNYDRFGHDGPSFGRGGGGNPFADFASKFGFGGFGGFAGGPQQQARYGSDISVVVKLTQEEIFNGVEKKYKYKRNVSCGTCDGNGGTNPTTCTVCNGTGIMTTILNTPIGQIQQASTCNHCQGVGKIYIDKCTVCNSEGIVQTEEVVEVNIPAGIQDGMTLSVEKKGNTVKMGNYGDLLIKIQEMTHDIFTRNGSDLKMTLNLTYPQLVLGDKVEIPTIEGTKIRISIPEYSEVGNNLRIPFKGTKLYGKDGRGDLIVSLGLNMVKDLDDETKLLIINLKEKLNNEVATE
jgi:molecular chaperone DnaJ